MNLSQLSPAELVWLSLLVSQITLLFAWAFTRSTRRLFWYQPPIILCIIFTYYTVFGPLISLQNYDWIDRGLNFRHAFLPAWQGASVSFTSFLAGYALITHRCIPPQHRNPLKPVAVWKLGQRINTIGFVFFALVTGPSVFQMLNPFSAHSIDSVSAAFNFGILKNYGSLSINLLIPGLLLMLAAYLKRPFNPLPLVLWGLVAVGIYVTLGFRYRLALLFSSTLLLWNLVRGRLPNIWVVLPAALSLLFMVGVIGLTRTYGRGLDLSLLEGRSVYFLLIAAFKESSIFLTSGSLMSLVPEDIPHVGITPLISTLLFPIPSQLLDSKESAQYLFDALIATYGDETTAKGAAILNYAEYFLMAGWPAIIFGYTLLGCLYRRLWSWYLTRKDDSIAQATYACCAVYLYVIVSRGYLPQVSMLFFFTVFPLFIVSRMSSRFARRI